MRVYTNMQPGERRDEITAALRDRRHEAVGSTGDADVCLQAWGNSSPEVLEQIRSLAARPASVPVVAMVDVLDADLMSRAAKAGVFSFVRTQDANDDVIGALAIAAKSAGCSASFAAKGQRSQARQLAPVPARTAVLTPVIRGEADYSDEYPAPRPTSMRVSLVIPAKNECQNLLWVLAQMPDVVDEVILVDGNSTDDSVEVARIMRPDIVVVRDEKPGKGLALRTGFAHASGDVIVMIDADGSMAPSEIRRMVYLLEEGFDFVKGSRFMAGGASVDITRLRRLGNRVLVGLVNLLWRVNFTDLCYGFCAFRRDALPALALRSDGFEIETEINIRAIKAKLNVTEAPSLESHRRFGSSHLRTFRDGMRVLRKILAEWVRRAPQRPVGLALEAAPEPALQGVEVV